MCGCFGVVICDAIDKISGKAVNLAHDLDVPVVGLVENMAYFKCDECGKEHHIFGGPNRHLSEEYGLKVYICPECHRTSARAVHQDPAGEANRYLQAAGQKAFEEHFPELSFREIFGKNYL